MRPQSQLSKDIIAWVDKSNAWFSYWTIDAALGIDGKKSKTLRRVVIKRLCDQGKLLRSPDHYGVYKKFTPAKRVTF